MKIGGLQPCSFIDYPGHLAAVVFTQGCNLRCQYCHNKQLLDPSAQPAMSESDVMRFLESRRRQLDGVVISGGEPTLQPGLRRFVEAVRALGFRVKLDTNGTRPVRLADLLASGLIDYVAMDYKAPLSQYGSWLEMSEGIGVLCVSLDVIVAYGVDHELRTTVVPSVHDWETLSTMAQSAFVRGMKRWVLNPYRPPTGHGAADVAPIVDDFSLEAIAKRIAERYDVNCVCRVSGRAAGSAKPTLEMVRP